VALSRHPRQRRAILPAQDPALERLRQRLQRIYFSAYQAGLGAPGIPGEAAGARSAADRLRREHRLYQADFLIRKYGFTAEDIVFDAGNNLSLAQDPKELWAQRHPEFYPVPINRAERAALLRVPGFGPLTVVRILERRRVGRLSDLGGLGLRGIRLQQALAKVRFD
jgi:predicted DNA-binding helix-hairpin-helix protein